ncbi:hypothetical protein TNCV_5078801 [Trichonephila clavipes]|nr:hypothetical protein TNCV_5078801 [Trichonephila clavipes]
MHLSRTLEVDTQASDTTKPIHQKTLLQKSARKKEKKRFQSVSLFRSERLHVLAPSFPALVLSIPEYFLYYYYFVGLEEKSGLRSIVCVRYPLVLRRLLCA